MSENLLSTRQLTPIALVPVGLKEAALDSPTFRSGVFHFAEQVDLIEKWLEGWLKAVPRLTQEAEAFEGIMNGLLAQMTPPANISEAILDHDYTLLALRSYGEGTQASWSSTLLGLKKIETNMVEPVRGLIHNDLRSFKETRRVLEHTQKVFDSLHHRYSALSRTKEPSSLREDAFQLHEAHKAYLKASMDFSVMAPLLRTTMDKVLVKVFSDQWRAMRNPQVNFDGKSRRWNNDVERVRSWSRETESGEAAFRRDLQNARRQIEDSTEARLRPSRDLEDYAIPPISNTGAQAAAIVELQQRINQIFVRAEKQGWLYLRTLSGKPTRTNWVRRWFFVKNGIFGWLVQGSRSGGVEESDRIGVLLCNVKPAQVDDRRFALEVKTKDLSIILQADSQTELFEWIRAFEIAKQKALEDPTSTDSPGLEEPSQDPAFAISSPPALEFAASAADSGVHQIRDDSSTTGLERGSTLPVPSGDGSFGVSNRGGIDNSVHRRSTATDRDVESGRDHATRIIQKLDLHRKSTGGPQIASHSAGPPQSGGGIASLIAASHNVMPVGPGALPQTSPMNGSALRVGELSKFFDLPSSSLAPGTLVNAPSPTSLSAIAVVVSGEKGIGLGRADATGGMPSGVMANVWGSSNWGYLNRLERGEIELPRRTSAIELSTSKVQSSGPASDEQHLPADRLESDKPAASPRTLSPSHRKTSSLPSSANAASSPDPKPIEYPAYYPQQLKTQDAQFRLLFTNVSRTERLMIVFRATWSLNDQQEFPGRVYVTDKYIYFYSHHLGLVLTSGIALNSISEVTAAPGRDYDLLFVHLKEVSDGASFTRVTVKAFLESLNILQQRLSFLVSSCNSEQPPDIETMMRHLIKLDLDASMIGLGKDSREDPAGTFTSDEGQIGGSGSSKPSRDLRAAVMFDGKVYGDTHGEARDATKVKLPRQPVIFVPSGMNRAIVDRIFDVSSKALFHLVFGDKSAVWQLLYHQRQAQRIKQGPWTQSEQRHLRRIFEYQIKCSDAFGRVDSTAVTDYQMIDVSNDHLCYVVTDRKTPWQLPYSQRFSLLNKIVITHHAKSRCRLAIYPKVDWTLRAGMFQNLITQRALKELEMDAMDLSELVTDQVKKLGAQSRTKRAIQIFGQLGVQKQSFEFAGSDAPIVTRARSMKYSSLASLIAESTSSFIQGVFATMLQRTFAVISWFWKTVSANKVILIILAASVLANIVFSSNSMTEWWSDRQARNYLARIGVGSEHAMSKALYLRDLDGAWDPQLQTFDGLESACRNSFEGYLSNTNTDAPKASASALGADTAYRASASRLQQSRHRLGSQRHDLVVALRVINSIEREMVEAEWEAWLYGEAAMCKGMEKLLHQDSTRSGNNNGGSEISNQQRPKVKHRGWDQVRTWHEKYCSSCFGEQQSLMEKRARSVR
ncbi:MAG: hypothetical protein Q9219_003095 [cf. Caloplaca sp. 3 TL-2023]